MTERPLQLAPQLVCDSLEPLSPIGYGSELRQYGHSLRCQPVHRIARQKTLCNGQDSVRNAARLGQRHPLRNEDAVRGVLQAQDGRALLQGVFVVWAAAGEQIYEQGKGEGEVKRRLRELIEYMKWRSGAAVLDAYQHYFDASRHAEVQDVLHRRLDTALKQEAASTAKRARPQPVRQALVQLPDDPDFDFLRSLGDNRDAD